MRGIVNKKVVTMFSVVAMSLLMSLMVSPASASPGRIPTADAYVWRDMPDQNFGGDTRLFATNDATDEGWSYLKFDLSDIDCDEICTVQLYLHVRARYDPDMLVDLHKCLDDTWGEYTITWNNKKDKGALIDQKKAPVVSNWIKFQSDALKQYVIDECNGDGIASFVLECDYGETWSVCFYSKEGVDKPYLEIYYRPVGGVWVPVDKFGLLAPYIGLASTIVVAAVATTIYAKRVKRRKEKR